MVNRKGWVSDEHSVKGYIQESASMQLRALRNGITGNAGLIDAAMNDLMPSAVHSNVNLDVTRRFSDITNSNARSKNSLVEAIREAMGEPVIMLNDREMGRYVRKAAFA